jgi:stringent starvation protein B
MLSLTVSEINEDLIYNLKKTVFYDLLNIAGRVFVVVNYSENVSIGNRGFLPEEKENGLVLVFNSQMNFSWEDYGISAQLVFGGSRHKCFIPIDDIIAIYSPEVQAQFITAPQKANRSKGESIEKEVNKLLEEDNRDKVVKVDFSKKRKNN